MSRDDEDDFPTDEDATLDRRAFAVADDDPIDDIEPVFYVRTWSGSIVPLRQGHRVLLGWVRHWWAGLLEWLGL